MSWISRSALRPGEGDGELKASVAHEHSLESVQVKNKVVKMKNAAAFNNFDAIDFVHTHADRAQHSPVVPDYSGVGDANYSHRL